jgi:hypothetical protein
MKLLLFYVKSHEIGSLIQFLRDFNKMQSELLSSVGKGLVSELDTV